MIKNYFNNIWKAAGFGATGLAYKAFWDSRNSNTAMTEMKAEIKKVNTTLTEMETKIENINKAVEEKAKLLKDHADIQSGIQNLGDIHNKYYEKLQGLSKQVEKESILKDYNDEFKKAFDKALQKAEELEKSINDLTKNFMGDNSILQKINEFKDYLATLSSTDICLVINISSSIFFYLV